MATHPRDNCFPPPCLFTGSRQSHSHRCFLYLWMLYVETWSKCALAFPLIQAAWCKQSSVSSSYGRSLKIKKMYLWKWWDHLSNADLAIGTRAPWAIPLLLQETTSSYVQHKSLLGGYHRANKIHHHINKGKKSINHCSPHSCPSCLDIWFQADLIVSKHATVPYLQKPENPIFFSMLLWNAQRLSDSWLYSAFQLPNIIRVRAPTYHSSPVDTYMSFLLSM